LNAAGHFAPALSELRRFHALLRKARNPFLEGQFPRFLDLHFSTDLIGLLIHSDQ